MINKIKKTTAGIKILEHKQHPLVCCLTNNNWICKLCNKKYNCKFEKFCCSFCDYNMCHQCRKLKNYERRKTIKQDNHEYKEKYFDKYFNKDLHEHQLLYCITSRYYLTNTTWNCNKCKKKDTNWSFYCTLCDYDLCFDCFKKFNK